MASVTETSLAQLPAASTVLNPSKKSEGSSPASSTSTASTKTAQEQHPEFYWMLKPCFIYKEEYKDCKSFKARFHQYFVHGKTNDCTQWKEDYDNCTLWEDNKNTDALKKVIDSEKIRVRQRLRAHYSNDVWENRTSPPADWNKELPESIKKGYENSHLKKKAEELRDGTERLGLGRGAMKGELDDEPASCSIM